jgi:hypothetical protein
MQLVWMKLRSSRLTAAGLAALPLALAVCGLRSSPETAMRFFLLFFPYVFLMASQDTVATELHGGGLENILFLGGKFRRYLWLKNVALTAAAGTYATILFLLLASWGAARGAFTPFWLAQFGLGLLVGLYYVAAAAALSHFLRAGSNVVMVLLVQTVGLVGLLLAATSHTGFIEELETGRFAGLKSRLLFFGLSFVFPNLIVSRRLIPGLSAVAAGLVLALAFQRARLRRLELRK